MPSTVRDVVSASLPSVLERVGGRGGPPVARIARRRCQCDVDGGFLGMLTAADVIDRCVADVQDPRVMRAGSLPQLVLEPGPGSRTRQCWA
jgi:CBS domain-containing protein